MASEPESSWAVSCMDNFDGLSLWAGAWTFWRDMAGEMAGVQVRHVNLEVQGQHPAWTFWRDVAAEMAGVQVRHVNLEVQGRHLRCSCIPLH